MVCYSTTEREQEFLEQEYLQSKYHIPEDVQDKVSLVAQLLEKAYTTFLGICLVGGLVNGSYVLRQNIAQDKNGLSKFLYKHVWREKVPADVDFYLITEKSSLSDIEEMAEIASTHFRSLGFVIDGFLNGRDPSQALDVTRIGELIATERFDLLSLPYQCAYGSRIKAVQIKIAEEVARHGCHAEIWEQIQFYHDSPLTLRHGSFSEGFMNHVLEHWYPSKKHIHGLGYLDYPRVIKRVLR